MPVFSYMTPRSKGERTTQQYATGEKPTRLDVRKDYDPRSILSSISTKSGFLNATDPVGQAIRLRDRILGAGGESVAYEAQIVYGQLGEDGWRQLLIPIITHQYVKQNSGNISHWEEHHNRATEEANAMSRTAMESAVKDFLEHAGVIGKDRLIALRVSLDQSKDPLRHMLQSDPSDPTKETSRESRQRYMLGLQHENLAYLFSNGDIKDGRTYGIVELLQGSLNPTHTKDWPLARQIEIAKQTVRGLRTLQKFGVILRDIKPENIFHRTIFDPTNPYNIETYVKLADYGLIKQVGVDSTVKTLDGTVLGTVVFMAPEQAHNSRNCSMLSDQFSLGAALYNIMTGNHPLGLQGDEDFLENIRTAQDRPHKLTTPLDEPNIRKEGMEMILARMMQYNSSDRYENCEQILEDIERIEKGKLPANTNDSYPCRVFTPSRYSNSHRRKVRKMIAAGLITGAVAAGCAATYLSGLLDPLVARIQ